MEWKEVHEVEVVVEEEAHEVDRGDCKVHDLIEPRGRSSNGPWLVPVDHPVSP